LSKHEEEKHHGDGKSGEEAEMLDVITKEQNRTELILMNPEKNFKFNARGVARIPEDVEFYNS